MGLQSGAGDAPAWIPGTLAEPTVLSVHTGPPADGNEVGSAAFAGERFTRRPSGSWTNADPFGFGLHPHSAEPTHVAVRSGGRIELAGRLPKRLLRAGAVRIVPDALSLRPAPEEAG